MKINILQRKVATFSSVAEVHMVEVYGAVCHIFHCISLILHFRNLIQNSYDSVCGCLGYHDHDKYESYHHQGADDLQGIDDHTGKLSYLHGTTYDGSAADSYQNQHYCIHGKLHNRGIPCHDLLCFGEKIIDISGNPMEFFNLIVLTDESLYHTGGVYILLYGIVQHIILIKYLNEMWVGCFCNKNQSSTQKWYGNEEQD